jgi:hypothetical protein
MSIVGDGDMTNVSMSQSIVNVIANTAGEDV